MKKNKKSKSTNTLKAIANYRWYLLALAFMITLNSYGQSDEKRTMAFVSTEFIVPSENAMIKGESKLNFSFGWGIGLNLKTSFSESSSLLYGLGYASVRRNFIFDGFSSFSSFAQFKVPIYYQYTLYLDRKRKNALNFIVGAQVLFQTGSKIDGTDKSSGNKHFTVENKGGVFPLVSFGFGYDLKFKNNYFISFKSTYNLGFTNATNIRYTADDKVLEYSSQLSHFNLKVSFPLFIPK